AFPDLTTDAMDDRLSSYVFLSGEYASFETPLSRVTIEPKIVTITDARVHALRALLYATAPEPRTEEQRAGVRSEVAEALRIDPREPFALFVQRLILHEHEDDLQIPKELIARDARGPLGWLLLGHARSVRHESTEALEVWETLRDLAE